MIRKTTVIYVFLLLFSLFIPRNNSPNLRFDSNTRSKIGLSTGCLYQGKYGTCFTQHWDCVEICCSGGSTLKTFRRPPTGPNSTRVRASAPKIQETLDPPLCCIKIKSLRFFCYVWLQYLDEIFLKVLHLFKQYFFPAWGPLFNYFSFSWNTAGDVPT